MTRRSPSSCLPSALGRSMGSWGLEMAKKTDDFEASAERVRAPLFGQAMRQCTPTSEVHLTRSTGNKWRRYDKLPQVPSGIVFIGDAICAFNPFYAQGMSSASRLALILAELLSERTDLDRAFFREFLSRQKESLDVPCRPVSSLRRKSAYTRC